ncbi:hypothetical protein N665_0215s0006 [Sinapis alba]|nr:hypothetical protein N665_0215s0006 [Sinapis alba]
MKASDSFWNPNRWCNFHNDNSHKKKDCLALKMEVNELLKKGHLRKFLSDKAKNLLNKETTNQPIVGAPASPPRHDRVITVIFDSVEVSGVSHADSKKSTIDVMNAHETGRPKRLLLGRDGPSSPSRCPGYIAHCSKLPRKKNSCGQRDLYQHHLPNHLPNLGLEENALTRKVTTLKGFSREIKQTTREVILPVYAEGINMSTKFMVVDCKSSYNMILRRPWIHDMGAVPSMLHQMVKFPTPGASGKLKETSKISVCTIILP